MSIPAARFTRGANTTNEFLTLAIAGMTPVLTAAVTDAVIASGAAATAALLAATTLMPMFITSAVLLSTIFAPVLLASTTCEPIALKNEVISAPTDSKPRSAL